MVCRHGFNKLAVEFLETSRVVIPAKTGLAEAARAYTALPLEASNELRGQFKQVHATFTVLSNVVDRYLESERKSAFGKLSKGFRMMFAENEIEKLRLSLVQCREALRKRPEVQSWTLKDDQIEPAAGIGYTALAAVLDRPDPTRGAPIQDTRPPITSPSWSAELPVLPAGSYLHTYNTSTSSNRELPSSGLLESVMLQQERIAGPAYSSESRTTTAGAHTVASRSSISPSPRDNLTEITTPLSSPGLDEMIGSQGLDTSPPKEAIRVVVDPSKAPRVTPKRRTGTILEGSKAALLSAVQQQNHAMMEQLLDCGVLVDNVGGRNLLSVAIVNNDFTSVRLLLLFGAEPNSKDKDGFTPLFSATQASFLEAAQLLLKYGADPNTSAGPYDENPYARALNSGQTPFVELYLKYGANSDGIMGNGNTPFIQAMTKTAPMALVDLMFLYNADPNCKNARGETALFRAINAERLDIIANLIDHGANPNLPGPKHMLWPSVHQPRTLELLLERGADLQRAPGVLELATSINSLEAVSILLKHGADPNAKKDGIFTPLCTAIRDDRGDLVDLLIAAGADPNLQASEFPAFKCITHHRAHLLPRVLAAGADPSTPRGIIETAVAHNEREALLILLEHKVDPNARSAKGDTPLTTAIRTGRIDLVDILLSYKADPGVRGQEWPISMAVKSPEILAKLLDHILPSKIIKGALEQAVVADQIESVKLLLAAGVSVEDKNGGVFSPLTTSIRENRKEIFRYLIDEAGADPNSPGEHLPMYVHCRV